MLSKIFKKYAELDNNFMYNCGQSNRSARQAFRIDYFQFQTVKIYRFRMYSNSDLIHRILLFFASLYSSSVTGSVKNFKF